MGRASPATLALWAAILALLAAGATDARAQGLSAQLDREARSAPGTIGIEVRDLGSGRVLYSRNPTTRRMLASNTKLFTTAAVLDRLGPAERIDTVLWRSGTLVPVDERFRTRAPGPDGEPATGAPFRLDGNLVIRGAGDPALGPPSLRRRLGHLTDLRPLARAVQRAGITRVRGRVIADDTAFDRRRGVPASGHRLSRYIGPISGLQWNDGRASGGGFSRDPAVEAANALTRELRRLGVRVDGAARRGRLAAGERARLAVVSSPPFRLLARRTNRASDNLHAEQLLKVLAARAGRLGTTANGSRIVRSFARRAGAPAAIRDGSGLTRSNLASPRAVVRLLAHMDSHDSAARDFFVSLPAAGRHGTLRRRMRGTAAAGRCRAKTGTLRDVSTLSGICTTRSGRRVAFSILVNRTNPFTARRVQDRIVARIARR